MRIMNHKHRKGGGESHPFFSFLIIRKERYVFMCAAMQPFVYYIKNKKCWIKPMEDPSTYKFSIYFLI